ncbi:hypothetical protein Poly21_06880 [Allorhodopirellula heiligendammensis]|uniref:Uncharacterized protein n=1 Tax=Allorhodopirellula heiligendammensis TaxID=2714739 RepID=A0A5C6C368_9BACT|nr:hypothetical protein Poly21_06880 [Allorhodopirellula heiligendammensis]
MLEKANPDLRRDSEDACELRACSWGQRRRVRGDRQAKSGVRSGGKIDFPKVWLEWYNRICCDDDLSQKSTMTPHPRTDA